MPFNFFFVKLKCLFLGKFTINYTKNSRLSNNLNIVDLLQL